MTVTPAREAATVILLRDDPAGAGGLQTWLLRRVPKMAFAAGMSVFPGGAVDAADAAGDELLADSRSVEVLDEIAAQLETAREHAGRLVCAAIRETFEEVGVLLSSPVVAVDPGLRAEVESRAAGFGGVLAQLGVLLDVTAIRPWSRWITPKAESRRYDTYFFVAALPDGAAAAAVTSEASHADWIAVDQALAEFRSGDRPMLPPTITTLTEIGQHSTVAEVLSVASQRSIRPVEPVLRRDEAGQLIADLGDGRVMQLPPGFLGASGRTSVDG